MATDRDSTVVFVVILFVAENYLLLDEGQTDTHTQNDVTLHVHSSWARL